MYDIFTGIGFKIKFSEDQKKLLEDWDFMDF